MNRRYLYLGIFIFSFILGVSLVLPFFSKHPFEFFKESNVRVLAGLTSDTGFLSPSACDDDYSDWTNPTSAYSSNDVYATATGIDQYQDYYNFGFSIPSGATIDGIEISVEAYCEDTEEASQRLGVELSWNGGSSYTSTSNTITWSWEEGEYSNVLGGSSDTWGRSWSDTEFSNTNFRIRLNTIFETYTIYVDHIKIKVYYTEAPSNNPPVITASSQNPSNLATSVGLSLDGNYSHFNISVSDPDGDTMNITWRSNASGSWTTLDTNASVSNGTYYFYGVDIVEDYYKKYWWSVNLSDGNGGWDNETYSFTTDSITPFVYIAEPDDGDIDVLIRPWVNVTVRCNSNRQMNVTFSTNASYLGNWVTDQTNSSISDMGYACWYFGNASDEGKTFWWNCSVHDGASNVTETFSFTTFNSSEERSTNQYLEWNFKNCFMWKSASTWTDAVNAERATGRDSTSSSIRNFKQTNYFCYRTFLVFNTSNIPDDATITGVSISLTPSNAYTSGNVYIQNSNTGEVVDLSDFDKTRYGSLYRVYSWSGGTSPINISLNQNVSTSVSKTGLSCYVLRFEKDYNLVTPPASPNTGGGWLCTGEENIKLWVTYNQAPTITGEIPANTSTAISLQPTCNVTVTDLDNNPMTVTFATNESTVWVNKQVNNSGSGSIVRWNFMDADAYSTKYWWRVYCYDGTVNLSEIYHFTTEEEAEPLTIIINFAGNLSDSGGPYWRPFANDTDPIDGDDVALTGIWSDGYFVNNTKQQEEGMYINCTVTDATGVHLDWVNGTTWTNGTYNLVNTVGDYWEIDTDGVIPVSSGYPYSFNVHATGLSGSNIIGWNKTGITGNVVRRYVYLDNNPVTLGYSSGPFYMYNWSNFTMSDATTKDRLVHDQGTDGTTRDTGMFYNLVPTDLIDPVIWCTSILNNWFDEDVCYNSGTVSNVYYHLWGTCYPGEEDPTNNSNATLDVTFSHDREDWDGSDWNNSNTWTTSYDDAVSYYYFNTSGWGEPGADIFNGNYSLNCRLVDIVDYGFTGNSIYEMMPLMAKSHYQIGNHPSVLSNRSFTSFVLFNVPSNATLNSTGDGDSDDDGLSDWSELYLNYTNPFLSDTDADRVDDYLEGFYGTDPNNYSDYPDILEWQTIFNYSGVSGGTVSSWNNVFNYSSVTGGDIVSWNLIFNYSGVSGGTVSSWNNVFNYSSVTGGDSAAWNNIFNYSSISGGDIAAWSNILNYTSVTGGDIASWSNVFNYSLVTGGTVSVWNNIFNYSSVTGGDISSWILVFNYSSISGGDLAGWSNVFNYSSISGGNSAEWTIVFNYSALTGGDVAAWSIIFNYSGVTGGDSASWDPIFNYSSVTGGDFTSWTNIFNYSAITGGTLSSWDNIFNYSDITGGDIADWIFIFNYSVVTGGDIADWIIILNCSGITGGSGAEWNNIFNYSSIIGGDSADWSNVFNYSALTGGDIVSWNPIFNYSGITGGNGANWEIIFNYSSVSGGTVSVWSNIFNYSGVTGGDLASWSNIFNYSAVTGGNIYERAWFILFNYSSITGGTLSSWNNIFNYSSVTGGDVASWSTIFNYSALTGGDLAGWSNIFNYTGITGGNIYERSWTIVFNYSGVSGGDVAAWSIIFNYSSVTGGDISDWNIFFNYSSVTGGDIYARSWQNIFNYTNVAGGDLAAWINIFNYSSISGGDIIEWSSIFNYTSITGGDSGSWINIFEYEDITGGNVSRVWNNIFNYSSVSGGNGLGWSYVFNYTSVGGGNITITYIVISDIYPENNSVGIPLQPILYLTVNQTYGWTMNLSFYFGQDLDNTPYLLDTFSNISNGTFSVQDFIASSYATDCFWRIQVDDGVNSFNYSYVFTTEEENYFYNNGRAVISVLCIFGLVAFIYIKKRRKG